MCKKMTMFKKSLCLKSIHEKIILACLSGPTIQAVSIKCPKIIFKKFCPKNLFAILPKFSSICEILAVFKKNSIEMWIIHKHWFLLNTVIFIHPAMIEIVLAAKVRADYFSQIQNL